MPVDKETRKLIAIMHADVKGYSRLMGEDESFTVRILTECRRVFSENIERHRGRLVNAPGDSILSEFSSVVSAVQCAVEIQKQLAVMNADLRGDQKMQFRIGVNIGDVIERGTQIYGNGVNIAARLEALADPGGICISKSVLDQIEGKLALGYEYLGEKTAKNIAKPIPAYRVLSEITDVDQAKQKGRGGKFRKIRLRTKKIKNEPENKLHPPKSKNKRSKAKAQSKQRKIFNKHIWIYTGVNAILVILNVLTLPDFFWFYWPVLIWGLLLFIHWIIWMKDANE